MHDIVCALQGTDYSGDAVSYRGVSLFDTALLFELPGTENPNELVNDCT